MKERLYQKLELRQENVFVEQSYGRETRIEAKEWKVNHTKHDQIRQLQQK